MLSINYKIKFISFVISFLYFWCYHLFLFTFNDWCFFLIGRYLVYHHWYICQLCFLLPMIVRLAIALVKTFELMTHWSWNYFLFHIYWMWVLLYSSFTSFVLLLLLQGIVQWKLQFSLINPFELYTLQTT